ncbi:hypothetical protein IGK28_000486 [Enterococcus sp. DIV0182]|uniref:N-acetyltransferase n=2 Tax=Enterococcus thailandicus TaxID=417368 RepID=A0A510WGM1_ENTTH|nr:hypothetical protein A5800_000654 [Enterococcus sp. 5B7_DIV0075]GEK35930.1 N-acetyltransferase [Enterococcus thailandicus]GMC00920.1 N-acetyltransferase [Enterococcus thailandicus]
MKKEYEMDGKKSMAEEISVVIREAAPEDAQEILTMSKQVGSETEFLVMDEEGLQLSPEGLALELGYLAESANNLLLVALVGDKIVGTASVKATSEYRIAHIGEIGISLLKEYWGFGLGTLLIEEMIDWAKNSEEIFRLELQVQVRNERAVHLYQKLGFKIESTMPRGARSDTGEFLDVYQMSYLNL